VSSLGALLVLAVLIPKPLTQLRVRFLHGGFPQLTGNDVVIATIGNIAWHGTGARPALRAAADSAATLLRFTRRGSTRLVARSAGFPSAIAIAIAFAFAAGALTFHASTGAGTRSSFCSAFLAFTFLTAGTARTRATGPFLGDRLLFLAHTRIEHGEGFIKLPVNFATAILTRDRSAARTATAGCRARGCPARRSGRT
jgi:hypothetical protein